MDSPTQTNYTHKDTVELKRMTQNQLVAYTQELQQLIQKGTTMTHTAWVAADGSYGTADIVVFHPEALTAEQWEMVHNHLSDDERITYVQAVLEGDLETVAMFEQEYDEPNPVDGYYGEDRTPEHPDTPKMSDWAN